MSIFNSLGSNYTPSFVFKYLLGGNSKQSVNKLKTTLGEYYGGQAVLTYKGRQALELALLESGMPKGSAVGINGFTCYVLYQAIERAGYVPVFIDVEPGELNFGISRLKAEHARSKSLKAVIVQNTLGLPAAINEIDTYCKANDILLIEDLAHSLGVRYKNKEEAGKVGQLVMLSFSQDKPIDVVAGGAFIDRRSKVSGVPILSQISSRQRLINRMYPFWSSSIRILYPIGLGRFLHVGLKTLHLLATPMSDNLDNLYQMTYTSATQLNNLWVDREKEFKHRQNIAKVYKDILPAEIQYNVPEGCSPLYLRFPIKVDNRDVLIAELKSHHVYIGDTWYDAPIAPKRYLDRTSYESGNCPNAEILATQIVNLPTHININERQATRLAERINQWLK